ncbi:hypothetical protein BO94DRAFT_465213 [Aspergillus sclerotioniger CBS 115572]|uniref:Fungal N-terminal domain-containing protein n=1 Tax=Aspergillus sclerotioniger CBS 115572 TaxID=1450535 RepID=A0A317WNT8_9EURO|nr:hypothetical protein BO94DRAFT_465213 [Aspergillus sclerotioniger CBS 115572]PWY88096.1 hypothetical protein BO94DRAFT_465213 [Aspergillus sclerotioniger CBS 115572]
MSGLDIAGLVFSILGIAETGAQLSQKLCNVYRRVKNANRSIDSLSSDVGLTCNVLRQLGDNLSHDEHAKLYSAQALSTAQDILRECKVVFEKINKALNESNTSSARNVFQRVRKGVGFVMVEEELHVLGSNLERLKSTMLLLLNVIMYAGQVRSRADLSTLEEQRSLIQKLVEEKKQNDQRFENLSQALGACIVTNFMTINGSRSEDTLSAELRAYNRLLGLILSEIDTYQSTLEQTRYQRVRNGILDIHSKEISHIRVSHGDMAADALNDRVAKRVEPSCTHLPRLPKPRRGDTAPISPRASQHTHAATCMSSVR